MANVIYIGVSLDGYIATPDGGLDWLNETPNPDQSDYGWGEFMSGVDAILMGRNTFEKVVSIGEWPYEKPVFVISATLKEISAESLSRRVKLIKGEPLAVVEELNHRGYKNLYIDGGITIQRFLASDLIDEMIITRIPVVLGGGYPLFGKLAEPLKFKHAKTDVLNNALVKSHYHRKR
ncbi:MAG: dihydrofolate reductase [Candidatus Nitronauta litoralis]|uniref:Dihydrofolate reductase n=1 Tax=Candidatus Nitronauta litoralis TaxID=2705533 RepID=A0A7T0BXC1_9BACT|nr:MAG: dihydrofolate reductase [Candidatus Nitronauta litoralis]